MEVSWEASLGASLIMFLCNNCKVIKLMSLPVNKQSESFVLQRCGEQAAELVKGLLRHLMEVSRTYTFWLEASHEQPQRNYFIQIELIKGFLMTEVSCLEKCVSQLSSYLLRTLTVLRGSAGANLKHT